MHPNLEWAFGVYISVTLQSSSITFIRQTSCITHEYDVSCRYKGARFATCKQNNQSKTPDTFMGRVRCALYFLDKLSSLPLYMAVEPCSGTVSSLSRVVNLVCIIIIPLHKHSWKDSEELKLRIEGVLGFFLKEKSPWKSCDRWHL